jgi:hypothetical protein
VLHKYVLCISAILSPENRDKVLLVEGVGGETDRQTERERDRGGEGVASATNFQNKIAAQGYIPHH